MKSFKKSDTRLRKYGRSGKTSHASHKPAHLVGFFVGSQKTLRIILIRLKLTELRQKQWKHVLCAHARKERASDKLSASNGIEILCT